MIVTQTNSTSYRDGHVVLTIERMTTTSPVHDGCGKVAKGTYYLEINDETKRMNADEFNSLKSVMRAVMGIEE